MHLTPRVLHRPGFPEAEVSRLTARLREFITRASLNESALVIHGPGLGLSSHFVVLCLLGPERFGQFRTVHAVSASSYAVLFFLARQRGMLSMTDEEINNFNQANQLRHKITGFGRGSLLVIRFLLGSKQLFSGDRVEEALAYGVRPEFVKSKVSELPEELVFLTYCVEDREVCEIRQGERFDDWSMSEVIRCVTAVKGIYPPLRKDGKTYMDAATDRSKLREHFRQLRNEYQNVLALHMDRDSVYGNTTYLKLHHTGPGQIRVMLDFLYFMCGIENRDINEGIRVGLRGVKPL